MQGYIQNIEKETLENTLFRKVVYTAKHCQLVLMCLPPNEELGMEVHQENDQFFRFEKGTGICILDDQEHPVADGSGIIVPSGAEHNIINTSSEGELKFYTIYSPPHHKDGTIHSTKEDEDHDHEEFDGITTE